MRTNQDVLRDQGRGITGALFVAGLSSLYTTETWWLGWNLPLNHLVFYAIVGLIGILVVTRWIGFQEDAERRPYRTLLRLTTDFTELLLQSFVTAYLILLAFGIVETGQSLITIVRIGLLQVVPLGFGAAVANQLLSQSDDTVKETSFPRNVSTYVLGAVFMAFPVAPTQEVEVIAVHAGWERMVGLIAFSVLIVYLILYQLEFRGHRARVESQSWTTQLGSAFFVYVVGVVVAGSFLLAFGNFTGETLEGQVQQTIVLAFIASIGASAGEVVL